MLEKDLQASIIDLGHLYHWRIAHFTKVTDSRGFSRTPVAADGKGFPDLCMVRERIIWVENKVGRNKLGPEQVAWRDAILAAGGEWYEWREADWLEGRVEEVLRRREVR
jgi:hypothetical protein